MTATPYHSDAAREARASRFYKDLRLTQLDKLTPAEQTELFARSIGGKVCTAIDDYAIFDFKKLDAETRGNVKDKTQAYLTIEPGNSAGKDADKLGLVFKLCGDLGKPDAAKINTENENVIKNKESCDNMAGLTTSKGNMYLLDNGKCVQSFG